MDLRSSSHRRSSRECLRLRKIRLITSEKLSPGRFTALGFTYAELIRTIKTVFEWANRMSRVGGAASMSVRAAPRASSFDCDDRGPCPVQAEANRSEEHTSELQSRPHLVCRLLLEKKKKLSHWYFIREIHNTLPTKKR